MRQYPQRNNPHQLEELSIRFFRNSLPRNWYCEQPRNDYGVDLQVHIFEGEVATNLILLIQLKASQVANKKDYETIRLRTTTYNYLWDMLQIVMLVKYVEEEKEAYWLLLSDYRNLIQIKDHFQLESPNNIGFLL